MPETLRFDDLEPTPSATCTRCGTPVTARVWAYTGEEYCLPCWMILEHRKRLKLKRSGIVAAWFALGVVVLVLVGGC